MRFSRHFSALYSLSLFAIIATPLSAQLSPNDPFYVPPPPPPLILAATPPMGWNSWQSYGLTIDEVQFRANASVLASIKQFGWQYAIIDEGWYMENPAGKNLLSRKYDLDSQGRLIPAASRFPTAANGAGFKPLADWIHSQGLKFGIHIVRGIPRLAAIANAQIGDTKFHAIEAADTSDTCPWDDGNYGIRDNPAGQAYYDQVFRLYADWGVDYVKVDCVSDHPYRPSEIRQIAEAIKKSGRPIILSLSPGPTQLEHAQEVAKYSQLWRISDDHWDNWRLDHKGTKTEFPFSTYEEFDRIATWNPYVKPGNWPDPDMLPLGSLTPSPGYGPARTSHLSHDEELTEFILWAISRSPLILGTDLTHLDNFTRSLITNQIALDMNQKMTESHPVTKLPAGFENVRVWVGVNKVTLWAENDTPQKYLAIFNLNDKAVTLQATRAELGLTGDPEPADDVFSFPGLVAADAFYITIPPHGSVLYQFHPQVNNVSHATP